MKISELINKVQQTPGASTLTINDVKMAHQKAHNFLSMGAPVFIYYEARRNILHVLPLSAKNYLLEAKKMKIKDPGLKIDDLTEVVKLKSLK